MRRIFTLLIAIIIGTAALAAHAMPADYVPEVRALASLPKGYTIHASAPSLAELIKQTKPNLTFNTASNQTMFMWSSKSEGKRDFTLATARLYSPAKGAARWVLLAAADKDLSPSVDSLVKRTIPVLSNDDVDKAAGKKNWARIVSMDPKEGTLYEIRYFTAAAALTAQESVVMVMHDPSHGWRFVTSFDGAITYGEGYGMKVAADARWTGNDKAPVEITVTRKHNYKTCEQYEEDRYAGALPALAVKSTRAYIIVKDGDTFSELMARHFGYQGMTRDQQRKIVKDSSREILKLNPNLTPEKLAPGQQIKIPSEGC